jgi:hypothetical protein
MVDSEAPINALGYIYVSTDSRRAGQTVGGENFMLTKEDLRKLLEIQRQLEDQQVWLTTVQVGFPTVFIGRSQDDITSQNRSPSVTELKVLELEREWGTGDMRTNKTEEGKELETQDHIV